MGGLSRDKMQDQDPVGIQRSLENTSSRVVRNLISIRRTWSWHHLRTRPDCKTKTDFGPQFSSSTNFNVNLKGLIVNDG